MERRLATVAVLALLTSVALPARAQFQPVAMKVKGVQQQAELAGMTWPGSADHDLVVLLAGGTPANRRLAHHDLINVLYAPWTAPGTSIQSAAVAWFDGGPQTSIPDVAWSPPSSYDLEVTWGEAPGTWTHFAGLFTRWTQGAAPIRLLPGPQPVLLATGGTRTVGLPSGITHDLVAVDLSGGAAVTTPPQRTWAVPDYGRAVNGDVSHDRIFPLRLSPGARAGGAEDAVIPFAKGFFVLWHDTPPAVGASLGSLAITPIDFGSATGDLTPFLPGSLATTLAWGSCLGAAGMDVDGDGVPDLVFAFGEYGKPSIGALLWISNGGQPLAMKAQQPWGALSGRSDLAAVTSVGTLRQLELDGGETAFVVADSLAEKLVVVRGDGASGFTTTDLPLAGAELANAIAVDVVGSPARDLVALVDIAPFFNTSEVWIYPDVGDLAPRLAWDPVPPDAWPIGQDLTLSVDASDADAPPLTLRWIRPPAADVLDVASVTIDGATLCDPATPIDVTVRAMDALGVYVTVAKTISLEERPSLRIAGADPVGRIELVPGGTAARAEGEAWPACASAAPLYTWGQVGLTGLVETARQPDGAMTAWWEFTIPEAAYPEALAAVPALTLGASGSIISGSASGTATLPLELDARGLVSATASFDQAVLAPGELGQVRVRLASRLGVALPAVLARVRLSGLTFEGKPSVDGAPWALGPEEGEVVIDPLPASGTVVEIELPVRSAGGPGGASVELFSSGGVRLSPRADPAASSVARPGCGCGSGSGLEGLALGLAFLLVGYMKPIRRVDARTR